MRKPAGARRLERGPLAEAEMVDGPTAAEGPALPNNRRSRSAASARFAESWSLWEAELFPFAGDRYSRSSSARRAWVLRAISLLLVASALARRKRCSLPRKRA